MVMRRMSRHQFEEELKRIVDRLRRYQPRQVILFGSFARGDYHALSDVDLLIVKETETPFLERASSVLALCEGDELLPVEPLIYTPEELAQMELARNPFIEQVLREGIVIYERQSTRGGPLAEPGPA
jgi:predicted nucleotidyltransferase